MLQPKVFWFRKDVKAFGFFQQKQKAHNLVFLRQQQNPRCPGSSPQSVCDVDNILLLITYMETNNYDDIQLLFTFSI